MIILHSYEHPYKLKLNINNIYIYKLNNNKLNKVSTLNSEGSFEVKDCNGDNIQDIVSYFRADGVKDCDKEVCMKDSKWIDVSFCNSWDKQTNEFVETKIGEE